MSIQKKPSSKNNDDVNILLLGPTGVGKTTFINAFANYLVYNTLDEAIEGPLQVVIPAWFTIMDKETFEEKEIIIGKPDKGEQKGKAGESCTRQCRSFVFRIGTRNLRLIDAPGIGDTLGILQDEKNFEDILAYIAQYDYLNGICILLKPDEKRLHILLRFCVKELLRHLHSHAKQNLMFVFTNTRSTHYEPGSTAPLLKELLRGMQDQSGTEIPFNRGNTFTFDNESFRFLALCKNNVSCGDREKQDYGRSWDYSIKEFTRLMQCIMRCDKHATRDTLSLNEAQQLIRKLSRPAAEIATLIQQNIQLAKKHRKDVESHKALTPGVLPQIDAKLIQLRYPRTVCTNEKCIKSIIVDGEPKVDYASHCHPQCSLVGVEKEAIGDEKLKECAAMHKQSYNCTQCGCNWKEHQHITYEFQKFMTSVDMNGANNTKSSIDAIDKRIADLKNEQEAIKKVCAKLTQFLQANALNPVNDDVVEYIEHFIREEQIKKNAGADNDSVIAGLRELLADYKQEAAMLRDALKANKQPSTKNSSNESSVLQPEEIFHLVGTLYRLPINGAKIRAQVEGLKYTQDKFTRNREQKVPLSTLAGSSSVMEQLTQIFS